jgi:phosphatidylserine decarboxylase
MLNDNLKGLVQFLMPKKGLTALAGFLANNQRPWLKNALIRYFMRKYDVSLQEALEENPVNYPSFNAFFVRKLKPETRPIASTEIISPVDGFVSELGDITRGTILQAKGRTYSVRELLSCNPTLAAEFEHGLFATLYLSPKDYHRVHMPINATLKDEIYVPGKLFSVQPATARVVSNLFAINERLVVFFDTPIGLMAMVLVGAVIVGAIGTSWGGDIVRGSKKVQRQVPSLTLQKGEEMGYFKLGSTVILLFAEGKRANWVEGLSSGDKIRFGQALGKKVNLDN